MPKKAKKEAAAPSEQARDFKALFYRRPPETHLFYEVGRIIANELEPLELIEKIIAALRKAVQFENATVYTVKKDMTGLDPFYSFGPVFRNVLLEQIWFDNGAPGMIAATGEPLFIADTGLFDKFFHYPHGPQKHRPYIMGT